MNININKLIISYDDINATMNINVSKLIIGYINKIHEMKLLRLPMQSNKLNLFFRVKKREKKLNFVSSSKFIQKIEETILLNFYLNISITKKKI